MTKSYTVTLTEMQSSILALALQNQLTYQQNTVLITKRFHNVVTPQLLDAQNRVTQTLGLIEQLQTVGVI